MCKKSTKLSHLNSFKYLNFRAKNDTIDKKKFGKKFDFFNHRELWSQCFQSVMDPETESQTKNDSKIGSKIGSILVCFASIILIIIGAIHDNPEDCTNGQATGFLIFGGSILACTASINFSILYGIKGILKFTKIIFELALFIVCIWASVHILGLYSKL